MSAGTGGPATEPLPAWRVEEFASLASTQALLRERLSAGATVHGSVLRALEQPAGRGRGGKSWASLPGGSYQSLAVHDRWQGALRGPGLTLALALHLAEELRAAGAAASVKWPNDVYLGAGKLAGVLSEYVSGHLIVGVGLNVNNPVPDGAAALRGWELDYVHELVLAAVRAGLASVVEAGERAPEALRLAERLAPVDHLRGREVTVRAAKSTIRGRAAGVGVDGALLVDTGEATIRVTDGTVLSWSVYNGLSS